MFCGSGSQEQTTGTLSGGGSELTLASAIDFAACPSGSGQVGQGITIYHAGSAPTISAPTGVTASVVGATGGTGVYSYEIVANDYYGGATAPTSKQGVSTGQATLTSANYINLCFTPSANAASYSVYRAVNGGAYNYLVTTFDSTPPSARYCYEDTGYNANGQGWGNSATVRPDWLPPTVPSGATNDWCQTTIASGVGTTAITLSGVCSSVTGQIVKHDDTAAVQAAANACDTPAGGIINFDLSGNFNIGYIDWPDTRTSGRGWIIVNLQGEITVTYPLTFGSPLGLAHAQNKVRITGGSGSGAPVLSFLFPT